MKALANQHSVTTLCRVLHVNRSTYYKWLHHSPSARELENRVIRACILELYARTDKRLGPNKMRECLRREYCITISCGRVYRLMKTMNLPKMSTVKPPKLPSGKSDDVACVNVLNQQFNQAAPNLVWVCDFTHIRVAGRFCYVCAILDLFSRKVIACRVSTHIDTQLAIDTLTMYVSSREIHTGLIFHTDRGSQFTSAAFRRYLDTLNIVQSFSAKGHPYDNAVMECFFKYLKKEETDRRTYHSIAEVEQSLLTYIKGFYNSVRPHSHNGGLTPNRKEALFMSA